MKEKKKKQEVRSAENKLSRFIDPVMIFLFFVFLLLLTSFKISGDDDIFWHLETGRYILENRSVPSADVFGFITSGREWIPFEWGWDVVSWAVFSFSGYTGLSVFRSLVLCSMFLIFFFLFRKLKAGISLTIILFLLLSLGAIDRFLPKPQMVSYLFYALLLYILMSERYSGRKSRFSILLIPLLFLLWANMHMGVLSGLVILGLFLISGAVSRVKKKQDTSGKKPAVRNSELKRLAVVLILSVIAVLVNPHGIRTYEYVYSHLNMRMLEDVFEWYSPFNKVFIGMLGNVIYIVFIACIPAVLLYSYRARDLFAALVCITFLVNSFRAARYSVDFMVVTFPFIVLAFSYFIKNFRSERFRDFLNRGKVLKASLILILIVSALSLPGNDFYEFLNYTRSTGFGIDREDYPVGAVRFIRENNIHKIGQRPFNSFGCGGYFIRELGVKNFIDSRNLYDEIYYDHKAINNKAPGFEKKITALDFDYFLWFYPRLPYLTIELQTSVVSYLINTPDEWKLVYWDDNSLVFLRNEAKFRDLISEFEYRFVNPLFYFHQREPLKNAFINNREEVYREIQRNYRMNPEGDFVSSMVKVFRVPVEK